MISGALFLGGRQSIGHIYKKNIPRIAVALFTWSAVYMIVSVYNNGIDANSLSFHPAIMVPGLLILVGVISFAVSALLNYIPVIKKWIV